MRTAALPRMLWLQTVNGFRVLWRIPAFSLTGLFLPLMFFAFFGLPNIHKSTYGIDAGAYLLASFAAYAASQMMVFNFGMAVAQERAAKQDLLLRATPLPPLVYLFAKVLVAVVFALLALLLLIAFAEVAGGLRLPLGTLAALVLRLMLGSVCFVGMGFAIGYAFSANAAPAITNLVYLPLAFASGIFVPLSQLPEFVQRIGPYLPTYHYGQLAWMSVGAGHTETVAQAALGLTVWTILFLAVAAWAYRVEDERKFG